MKLATRVLVCALVLFVFSALSLGQTPRSDTDPRNISPSVGTGGPEGGPTGLFTIYDGQTLRRGEFTFSFAFSNYDRDPGNADITDWPASFNIGVNDHLELFFKTNAYRGIKVNNPLNVSGFYLPNIGVYFSGTALGSAPAIILAPSGPNVGTMAGRAVFRPAFCNVPGCPTISTAGQPFVQYPFAGGAGPNFGLGPGALGTLFGFPGFSSTLGPFTGNTNNFGAAGNFPGVGSPVGGILPGIVLATATVPATVLSLPITVPVTFTVAPSYLPDAPFVGRLYGESSFTNFVAGAKWRITGPRNAFGFGLIPFYRWYPDKGTDASGFNQLQRGASPGGNVGDFGLVAFADGRLSRSVNLSANFGYILNSNPKGPGGITMLDRPDEVIAGIGVDFPINRHFQPIAEFRSTQYVGGRTPNALQNNPIEWLIGAKIYPGGRWWGIGGWYRRALNDQRFNNFNNNGHTISVGQVNNVFVPGRGLVNNIGPTSVTTTGTPPGFIPSSDPYGFGGQFWIGRRNKREPSILPNQPPTASLAASASTITLPCPPGTKSDTCPSGATGSVNLTTTASDPDGDTLLYSYTVTGGRVSGEGANVTWDLSGLGPGTYTASVDVDDGCGCITSSTTTVTIASCTDCKPILVCPTVAVTCPSDVSEGGSITFTANFTQGTPEVTPTYNWTVSAGTITSGQGTSSITVDTKGLGGQTVTATVEVGGVDPNCGRTASCSTPVRPNPQPPRKFDEYGNIRFNDEKARLDNFAIQLDRKSTRLNSSH